MSCCEKITTYNTSIRQNRVTKSGILFLQRQNKIIHRCMIWEAELPGKMHINLNILQYKLFVCYPCPNCFSKGLKLSMYHKTVGEDDTQNEKDRRNIQKYTRISSAIQQQV